jgi:hypothetical protein
MQTFRLKIGVLSLALAGLLSAAGITPASSAEPLRLVVLELFTSQGCSSCPPADALLRDLSRSRDDILPLAFHVTYWNYLGWRDPFSFDGATERQRQYARLLAEGTVYTPQLVVDGSTDVVGSDRPAVQGAILRATAVSRSAATIALRRVGQDITIDIGSGSGGGTVYVVGYDTEHRTPVGRGENGGRTLTEANIVRGFAAAGEWSGPALSLRRPRPEGEHIAVFVQAPDGHILAAARESGGSG